MLFRNALRSRPPRNATTTWTLPELVETGLGMSTSSGQNVTVESAKRLATAYRCANIISDHIGIMPLNTIIRRRPGEIEQMQPNWVTRNIAYLLEVQPNRWMNPFIFKKTRAQWLIHYGNSYVWLPPSYERELFLLPADRTYSWVDERGNMWHRTQLANNKRVDIPDVEIVKEMINSEDGINGRGVITFARETMGRQQGAHRTVSKFMRSGLNASAVMQMIGELNPAARKKVKDEFMDAVGGAENAGGIAVIDSKVAQFTPITMKAVDMQFLQLIAATDVDIANFFGMPLHMVNMGKQAYNSNDQKFGEYLGVTLDPYLVQGEQAGRTKWLPQDEQPFTYFKYTREALLRMDPETRAKYNQTLIGSAQRTPDEARDVDDYPSYASLGQQGGDVFYMASNIQPIGGGNATN